MHTTLIAKALYLIATLQADQKDKAGKPYLLHLLRVAGRINTTDENIVCAALLHDILEDTPLGITLLRREFGEDIAYTVDCLTRRDDEDYMEFIRRCARHEPARIIKMADLTDNADLSRIDGPAEGDFARQDRYISAFQFLRDNANDPSE